MGRLLWLVWLAGCSFRATEGGPVDASSDADANVDAQVDASVEVPVTGSLSVTMTTLQAMDYDLSAEGMVDWAHWGYAVATDFDHKAGASAIGNLATTPAIRFTGSSATASWTDGTPHSVMTAATSGVGVLQGSSMQFAVAANQSVRTLRVYCGVRKATAGLDVSLSDNSAPAQSTTLSNMVGNAGVIYVISYNAATTGRTLTVTLTDTNDFAADSLTALLDATLQ